MPLLDLLLIDMHIKWGSFRQANDYTSVSSALNLSNKFLQIQVSVLVFFELLDDNLKLSLTTSKP